MANTKLRAEEYARLKAVCKAEGKTVYRVLNDYLHYYIAAHERRAKR